MDSLANRTNGFNFQRIGLVAKGIASIDGLLIKNPSDDSTSMLPLTLLPSPFPQNLFQQGVELQQQFSLLFHKVACDHGFLSFALEKTIASDDFIARLWSIYETVRKEGLAQTIFMNLNRSDYVIDSNQEKPQLKQVECNKMRTGLDNIMQNIVPFHRLMAEMVGFSSQEVDRIPRSSSIAREFARGMLFARRRYNNPNAAILFVVENNDCNIVDQRLLERALYRIAPDVVCLCRSLESLKSEASLGDGNKLFVGTTEVAIVYFRQGYTPEHFPDEETWAVKLLLERSLAIKCPCVQYMLANTKKVQQVLSDPSQLQRFVPDMETAESLLATFVGQYSLDNEEKVKDACNHPDRYVLKPQREGGGNNFYNDDLKEKLTSLTQSKERDQFILTERIRPPLFNNFLLKAEGPAQFTSVISELGVFGVFVGSGRNIFQNQQCGHLLRTMPDHYYEEDQCSGTTYVDSPYLIQN